MRGKTTNVLVAILQVGFMKDGRIMAADFQCYINGGCTKDESELVSPSSLILHAQAKLVKKENNSSLFEFISLKNMPVLAKCNSCLHKVEMQSLRQCSSSWQVILDIENLDFRKFGT